MPQSVADHHFLRLNETILKNPYPFYKQLRAEGPVFQEPDFGVFLVSQYDQILEVTRQPEVFSSHVVATGPYVPLPCPVDQLPAWRAQNPYGDKILSNDPPDHTRHKRLINRFFTPKRVTALEPRIRATVNETIDAFIDRGEVEFVTEFAHMIPRLIVGELLGVPQEDNARFKEFFGERLAAMARAAEDPSGRFRQRTDQDQGITEDAYLREYFIKAIAERKAHPRGDIMSDLTTAEFGDGEEIAIESIVSMITLLYAAGGDANTPELMTNSMLVLLSHPEVMAALRADPSAAEPFIEEVLRYDTPVPGVFRVATRDSSVGGVPVPKGGIVMIVYASANHDEAKFACPAEFDRERTFEHQHLGFGNGVHFCPGASLARLEGRIAVQEVLRRLGNIRRLEGGDVPYVPSVIQRIPIRLKLGFEALA